MNLEDIKKLTVADLKKELKARNLTVSGNKNELMQRLSEHIAVNEEHQILDQSGRIDESLLEGVQEDEVLGISPGKPPAPTAPLTAAAKKMLPKQDVVQATAKPTTMKPVGDTPSTPVGSLSPTQPAPVAKDSSSAEAGEAKKIRLKPSVSTEEDAAAKAALKPAATLDPDQAKIERAKKFNVPLSESDRKKLRAERFGTDQKSKATAASVSSSKVASDPALLQKRAQRFGVPVKSPASTGTGQSGEKLAQRAERFGLQNKQGSTNQGSNEAGTAGGDSEKLLKRKMRFGGGAASSGNGDASDKKKARAERFGISK